MQGEQCNDDIQMTTLLESNHVMAISYENKDSYKVATNLANIQKK